MAHELRNIRSIAVLFTLQAVGRGRVSNFCCRQGVFCSNLRPCVIGSLQQVGMWTNNDTYLQNPTNSHKKSGHDVDFQACLFAKPGSKVQQSILRAAAVRLIRAGAMWRLSGYGIHCFIWKDPPWISLDHDCKSKPLGTITQLRRPPVVHVFSYFLVRKLSKWTKAPQILHHRLFPSSTERLELRQA